MKIHRQRPPPVAVSDLAGGARIPARAQVAALCWRMVEGKPQVLLVTSRDTGRWVLPKGWPKPGKSDAESARDEAWEEAGVEGASGGGSDEVLGHYAYLKTLDVGEGVPCIVSVHPLEVASLARDYPERRQRKRRWFAPRKAAQKVDEPELREILRGFVPTATTRRPG